MNTFKLISYNIMSGCFENYKQDSLITPRYTLLKEGLKVLSGDFVGLVDTFKWKESFSEETLKKDFNYKHVFSIDMEDTRVEKNIGLTVLTNLNVVAFNVLRAFNRNVIETVLEDLFIYTVYLDDLSEETRLLEIESLLKQIKTPCILHGDFNSIDIRDLPHMNSEEEVFINNNPELSNRLLPIVNEMKQGKVVDLLLNRGFKDAFDVFTPTIPTKLFPAIVSKPFQRLDYIFYSEGLSVTDSKSITDPLFDQISDHFPISIKIISL